MYAIPLVDEQNPCYCPEISSKTYLTMLHTSLSNSEVSPEVDNQFVLNSFARILGQHYHEIEDEEEYLYYMKYQHLAARRSGKSLSPPAYSPPSWRHPPAYPTGLMAPSHSPSYAFDPVIPGLTHSQPRKRKRSAFLSSDSFSDLRGPEKRGRSSEVIQDSSFDISRKAERLDLELSGGSSSLIVNRPSQAKSNIEPRSGAGGRERELLIRMRDLEDQLYGPDVGTDTPSGLKRIIQSLDRLLPGIGIKNTFHSVQDLTHQKIVDVLGRSGHLNVSVLNLLRSSNVKSLSLATSICDADGLNLTGRDVFSVFSKPNSFLHLSQLAFSRTPIDDSDLVHIQHLPRLEHLGLEDTCIGNEAVYLLVALKNTLVSLDIASNPCINDSSVCALLLLFKLEFLSICDTGIGMVGLRELAKTIVLENRVIDIEIPTVCEFYVDNMRHKYMINPEAPCIVEPSACSSLSVAALKRNLSVHATFNPEIITTGSKPELVARLQEILETRKLDLLVREMIWGD